MPPEEMTGSTHILEFMCYAIAGSAGIRFCMEMVMSSSSDASAQRRRRRVGRRRGVLRGLAGAALRAPLICMKGAAAPSPQRPRRTSRQASDASSRSSSMLNQASRLATPVQPSQSLASNKFSMKRAAPGRELASAAGFAVAVVSIAAKICGVVGGPPADD